MLVHILVEYSEDLCETTVVGVYADEKTATAALEQHQADAPGEGQYPEDLAYHLEAHTVKEEDN